MVRTPALNGNPVPATVGWRCGICGALYMASPLRAPDRVEADRLAQRAAERCARTCMYLPKGSSPPSEPGRSTRRPGY
jgi:hypothetical protein